MDDVLPDIHKALSNIQKTGDHIESDLIDDRSEIEVIKNEIGKLKAEVKAEFEIIKTTLKGLESRLPRTESKISDAVSKGVSEGVQELREDVQKMTADKVVVVKRNDSLWYKLFGKKGK